MRVADLRIADYVGTGVALVTTRVVYAELVGVVDTRGPHVTKEDQCESCDQDEVV